MSCCCEKVFRLCDQGLCDGTDLVLPVDAPTDGEYLLKLQFLGTGVIMSAALSAGDPLTFSKEGLNEQFTYVGQIFGPDGEEFPITVDGQVYDCIEFTTKKITTYAPAGFSS